LKHEDAKEMIPPLILMEYFHCLILAGCWLGLLFYTEDGGRNILKNLLHGVTSQTTILLTQIVRFFYSVFVSSPMPTL
jgi:hypothetical protein